MKRSIRAAVIIALISFFANVHAAETERFTIKIQSGESTKTIAPQALSTPNAWSYNVDLAETIETIAITHPETVARIEHRATIATAIGDEGPWHELNLERHTPWKPVAFNPHQPTFTLPETPDEIVVVTASPAEIIAAADQLEMDKKASARWMALARKCDGNSEYNPCYAYKRADALRITRTDGKRENLTIEYPGGC
jgi:hypothetical protein